MWLFRSRLFGGHLYNPALFGGGLMETLYRNEWTFSRARHDWNTDKIRRDWDTQQEG